MLCFSISPSHALIPAGRRESTHLLDNSEIFQPENVPGFFSALPASAQEKE